jgi:hypothetical protein
MKTVIIRDNDHTIATLHQPVGMSDKDFDEFATAVLLTLANQTGRPMAREEVSS